MCAFNPGGFISPESGPFDAVDGFFNRKKIACSIAVSNTGSCAANIFCWHIHSMALQMKEMSMSIQKQQYLFICEKI